jgi:hypothetical protein
MGKLPLLVQDAVETLIDNIVNDNECAYGLTRLDINNITWKVIIRKSKEREITLTVKRQKRQI